MKKIFLPIIFFGLFVACVNENQSGEPDVKNDTTATTTPIINEDNDNGNNAEADNGTVVDPSECYLIQIFNELGEPVDAYDCMTFDKKVGNTFEEAFATVKPELDELVQRMVNDEKDGANFDASKWELRQVVRDVKNSPNEDLAYTSIELYMFSKVFKAYTIVYQFFVIDSEGNLYQIAGGDEGEV